MKQRLHFLDGIRGLTALYVVLFHARFRCPTLMDMHQPWGMIAAPLAFGHYAVGVFIVLSGFLLMLPVAQGEPFRNGIRGFFIRRARRIMPPYYAALFLYSFACLFPVFYNSTTNFLFPVTVDNFLAHIFFVQNLRDDWSQKIDSPLWTIATEVQIYVLFAIMLLPLSRIAGVFVTAAVAVVIGVALHFIHPLLFAAPWYLGLFAFGMAAAVIHTTTDNNWCTRFPWKVVGIVGGTALLLYFAFLCFTFQPVEPPFAWALDIAVGVVVACGIIALAQNQNSIRTFFESRPLQWLAQFSYSLYLFHLPLLFYLASLATEVWHLSPWRTTVWVMAGALPLTILLCYGAYWFVERHCATTTRRAS